MHLAKKDMNWYTGLCCLIPLYPWIFISVIDCKADSVIHRIRVG